MEDLLKDVTPDMLSGIGQEIAKTIGMEAALKLFARFGGVPVYMPKISIIRARARAEQIRTEFKNGESTRDLAKRYHVSMRMIERVISKSGGLRKYKNDRREKA